MGDRGTVVAGEGGSKGAGEGAIFQVSDTQKIKADVFGHHGTLSQGMLKVGDSVTANLASSLAAGATLRESLEIAMSAASVVIHQLGTTGTATVTQIQELLR